MTVAELVAHLKEMPQDAVVWFDPGPEADEFLDIDGASIYEYTSGAVIQQKVILK